MRTMTSKSVKWLIWIGIGIAVLVAAVAVVTAVFLPGYVEGRLIPRLGAEFGLHPADIQVRRIGLWGSDVGPIRLRAGDAEVITIAAIQIDYSPLSLMQGEIKGLTVGGLGIRVSVSPDGATIAGVRLPANSAAANKSPEDLDLKSLLPIELGRLAILKSHLTLEIQDRRIRIPFDLELQTGELGSGRLTGLVNVEFMGNPITLSGSLDQEADRGRLEMAAPGFHLNGLAAFIPATLPVQLKGRMDLDGKASFGLRSFDLNGLALTGRLREAHLMTPRGNLRPVPGADGQLQPIEVSVTGESPSELKWRFAPFQVVGPASMTVKDLSGTLARGPDGWAINADVKTIVPEQPLAEQLRISTAWPADWKMAVRHHREQHQTEFELTGLKSGPFAAIMDGAKIMLQKQDVALSGALKQGVVDAQIVLTVKGIRVDSSDGNITVPELKVEGILGAPPEDENAPAMVEVKADFPGIIANLGPTAARLPKATFQLSGRGLPRQSWQFGGRLKLSNGRVTDPERKLRIRNLSVDLPLAWPETKSAPSGRLRAGDIEWNGQAVGGAQGTLRQKNLGLNAALTHVSKLFPGLRVLINAGVDRTGSAAIDAKIPRHHLKEAFDLGRFQPAAAGMMVSGHLEADAKVTIDNGRLGGSAQLKFNQGRLHQTSRNLLLEGVDMQVYIDDMEQIQSAPQQKLTVQQVTFGNLKARNLAVDFQLEHPTTLFVEKAQIDWSEGKVNTAAIRIVPGVDEYDVILFCDRLNLAMVLEQLGAAQAKGDGSVNGRIPIHWANGRLTFDNGFLFSSPGQTGAIQIKGTEVLLAGLPPGTPQHAQLDIATEALKDYTYKWAKLMVQTEDDILLLKLQFDGKPNRLLPFAYDQQLGQFKRVAGQGQADFKGISIDLNLRSPLNEIMNYKELLN